MMSKTRWLVAMLALVAIATFATLSARGRDDDKKLIGFQVCEDVNQNLTVPQWSYLHCVEGHECVMCEDDPGLGDLVGPTGGPKQWNPVVLDCTGDRIIGICTGNGRGFCDISNHWVDGQCSGVIRNYADQPQQPPPGDT
jgi:hypothetical protein